MERLALPRLLAAVATGELDCVVVYARRELFEG